MATQMIQQTAWSGNDNIDPLFERLLLGFGPNPPVNRGNPQLQTPTQSSRLFSHL